VPARQTYDPPGLVRLVARDCQARREASLTKGVVVCSQPQLRARACKGVQCAVASFWKSAHTRRYGACTVPRRRKSPRCQLAGNSIASGLKRPVAVAEAVCLKRPACSSRSELGSRDRCRSTRPDRVRTEPPVILAMSGKTSVTATPSGGRPPGDWRRRNGSLRASLMHEAAMVDASVSTPPSTQHFGPGTRLLRNGCAALFGARVETSTCGSP
jgi:hypothetical protein